MSGPRPDRGAEHDGAVNETIVAGQTTAAATQTLVMSVLGLILAGTAVWQAVRALRGRPRAAARREAERRAEGLLAGWAAGILWGSWTAWSNGLKPLASLMLGGATYTFYVGLGALILNIAVAAIVTVVMAWIAPAADERVPVRS